MLSSLEQSILSTLVYFDIFEYPLTLLEIHRLLLRVEESGQRPNYTLGEVRAALFESEKLKSVISFKNGWFYLRGQEHKVRTRAQRLIISLPKFRRAKKVSRLLAWVPFVRFIAVCNSLSYSNARQESDIDLFIIAKKGGTWWARLISLLILKLLRLRPGQGGVRDKICLSFFVDSEHLNLETIKMGEADVYLPIWLATLYPLYDAGACPPERRGYYQKLWPANLWLASFLPDCRPLIPHALRLKTKRPVFKLVLEILLGPFSFLASRLQQRAFPKEIQELANQDTRVRVESGLLKFHVNDRREEYSRLFFERINKLLALLAVENQL